jgi:hypothetical protein
MSDRHASAIGRSWSAIERELSPRAEEFVETSEFRRAVGILLGVNAFARRRAAAAAGGVWHLLNLPTGRDVARLRRQVGELDREIRRLSLQLERQQTASNSATTVDTEAEHSADAPTTARAPRRSSQPSRPRRNQDTR